MSAASTPDEALIRRTLAARLAEGGAPVELVGWQSAFGGNARQAYAFDAAWANGRTVPSILLSQVAGKHVDSDTAAEFAVLRALNGTDVRSPDALLLDASGEITGSPSIVLERMPGKASAVDFLAERDMAKGKSLSVDLARATADLHRFDITGADIAFDAADPVGKQVESWHESFRENRLEPHPVLDWLFGWLRDHAPRPVRHALVHGDLRPGNFLYEGDRVTALLDWEMAHVGDPAEDIGWIYRKLWSPEKFLSLDEFLTIHAEQAGFVIPRRSIIYYRIFSEAKFAAISVAAAHHFATGGTSNLRHIDRAAKIPECLRLALGWIASENWEAQDATA
jgi:aminoglycoside phosphotransferase (APT) family kinase protein